MKVPYKWLKDYVQIDIDAKELADRLTLSGSKVEEVISAGDEITNVVTGKIESIAPHPDADKLVICQLNVGEKELVQIVTGANNMVEGDIVPVALHGASLPNGMKIKKGKLRGIVSNGMMCSEEELGIPTEEPVHGLMILPKDTPMGKDIKGVLGLNNEVIDFEITSNRPDCLSVIGIARETAATLGIHYSMPNTHYETSLKGNIQDEIQVEILDKEKCNRYMARAIKNVKIAPSPEWMQERLLAAGVRPINNIVDITNFVMIELGQPMHAFDKREINSGKIVVDTAKEGEKFTTLDEVERQLNSDMLCIKDSDKIIGLAGIMGGLDSEIKEDTTEVIFESANFNGINIRVNSKKLGLRTESSSRFEKEIHADLAEIAMDRACSLVEELQAGDIVEGTIDIYTNPVPAKEISVQWPWVNEFLGTALSAEEMKEYLDRLELKTEIQKDILLIKVPSFRIDVNIKQDIAEEIARIYGYNNIPITITKTVAEKETKNLKQRTDDLVISTMISSGLYQSISYSFVSPKTLDKINAPEDSYLRNNIKIKNPLGEDFSIMRTTTIPSMMESLSRNYSRNIESTRLFEIGKIYLPKEREDVLPNEKNVLCVGLYGRVDYYHLKGIIENLLDSLGVNNFTFKRQSSNTAFHPGKTADLYCGKNLIGLLGEVHPDVCDKYEIELPCYVAEIDLDELYNFSNLKKSYKPLPKYPAVTRDLALIVDDAVLVQDIEDTIGKQGGNLVESIKLFDVYKGKQIPDGKKSIAYSIVYRAENRTLTDNDINKVHDKIVRSLEYKLGAQLR
ncbi:phenylalanyl-tRNA synthetase beta subunit [Clostridium amylolyticum]|uniref:Phenylalanine--tRNA ligase beta subunit n=1 Tax=Clostridium amylolyticum TaxID=1121298 RepID=A0A1M6KNG3_9CLOT|nr:phenylalanine--tRNA ligase subunit beta [Clostridium amylolyticum]SHJ60426.1 phenylalanyl-tRNA synthetase beta subunit [Clostridium amylolyticum]